MVTEEEWDSVQFIRQPRPEKGKKSKKQHPRRVSSPYLLTGLVFCAECGGPMVSDYSGHGKTIWRHYVCFNKKNGRTCYSSRIRKEVFEHSVINAMVTEILTPETLKSLYQWWAASTEGSLAQIQS